MSVSPTTDIHAGQVRALALLRRGERFLLTGHVRPDGDCIGAQAALASTLQALGKTVWILNTDPLPESFDYLAEGLTYGVYTGGPLPAHDVTVLLDFCELERTGEMATPIREGGSKKLVVDHHLFHGEPWWDEAYLDPSASATGLLTHRIARGLGVELDPLGALGVFTSLVTDTGWFKYSNTDAETLRVAAEMVERGVDPARMFGSIYQRNSRTQPLGVARALSRLEYVADGRIAVIDLPAAAKGEAELGDGDELLDILRAVKVVEAVLFLRELRDGTVKLSARSKGAYDVNRLARKLGGGGHAKASGAGLPGPLAEARTRVVAEALAQLEEVDPAQTAAPVAPEDQRP